MIRVSIESKDKKHIDMIRIHGHAMYADFGKDIVCSSVSSIIITTVNGICEINKLVRDFEVVSGVKFIYMEMGNLGFFVV